MSYDSIFKNGELSRKKTIAALACYCVVKTVKAKEPEKTLTSIVGSFMTMFDINEDEIPHKWLCDEYYRIQKRDYGKYNYTPNKNSNLA